MPLSLPIATARVRLRTMLHSPAADERAAMQLDELASALDAGLPIESLGGDPSAGERAVQGILAARGVRLSPSEDAVLSAAWSAGRVGSALRARAEQRRQRAEFGRELRAGLRYPAVLVVLAGFISLIASQVFGYGLLIGIGVAVAAVVTAVWFVRRGILTGGDRWLELPWFGPLGAALGELPYLETLHALYSAGVPIVDAHATATGAVSVASLRIRLRQAERALREGGTLAQGLASSGALLDETRQLLASGETAGQLEEALQRTLTRRRETTARAVRTTAKWAGHIAYGAAVAVAVYFIFSFYLSYIAALRR